MKVFDSEGHRFQCVCLGGWLYGSSQVFVSLMCIKQPSCRLSHPQPMSEVTTEADALLNTADDVGRLWAGRLKHESTDTSHHKLTLTTTLLSAFLNGSFTLNSWQRDLQEVFMSTQEPRPFSYFILSHKSQCCHDHRCIMSIWMTYFPS